MARKHVGIEAGLRDAACDHRAHIGGGNSGALESGAGGFDAQIDRRDGAQNAVVIGEGSAHAVEEPDVVVGGERSSGSTFHGYFSLSRKIIGEPSDEYNSSTSAARRSRTAR